MGGMKRAPTLEGNLIMDFVWTLEKLNLVGAQDLMDIDDYVYTHHYGYI